ncbi:hypothetical protein [Jeotgalicoccus psychrophilus]|uniref:hypothetical protein n=1 Tax=Jeotgalicoccus psychrophilus TaxID=157228 RepID=UPI0003FEA5AF|nr:hypothetical protein [Jeotgalicoccus psychrophilus]
MENKLNIVRPDSDGREKFLDICVIEASDIKISDEFIQKLASRTSFIETLRAIDLFKEGDLRREVSELRQEVSELKQKLEEK